MAYFSSTLAKLSLLNSNPPPYPYLNIMTHLVLDITNPALAPLAAKVYSAKHAAVPNSKLPASFRDSLNEFYFRLTGENLNPEASTLTVVADNGKYKGLYRPSLYSSADGKAFVLQWGREALLLTPQKGGTFEGIDPEKLSISFAAVKYGNSLDVALRLMYFDEADSDFSMDVQVRSADRETELVAETLNNLLGRNPAKAVALLAKAPEINSFDGPQFSAGDLEEGVYDIISYRPVNTKWGLKHMLLCAPNPELGQKSAFELWSDQTSSSVLSLDPKINEEFPAQVTIWNKRQTKRGTIAANQTITLAASALPEANFDLDF